MRKSTAVVLVTSLVFAFSFASPAFAFLAEIDFESNITAAYSGHGPKFKYNQDDLSNFFLYFHDYTGDGVTDTVEFSALNAHNQITGQDDWWDFTFSTRGLGTNLAPGVYSPAGSFPFEGIGRAGFEADVTGVALADGINNFEISDIEIDENGGAPILKKFNANFKVTRPDIIAVFRTSSPSVASVDGPIVDLQGNIKYSAANAVVPEPSTFLLLASGLAVFALRRKLQLQKV